MKIKNSKLNVVFFGTSNFAVPTLKSLIDNQYNIAAVYTVPDKPAGRKQILTPPAVKELSLEHSLKVIQPKTLKDDSTFEEFKSLQSDLCVVAAYGKLIPDRYLEIPQYKFLNIHPSLLPKYRGPSPIQSAILNGDTETGLTIMVVDAEMDHGPILKQATYDLRPTTNFIQAYTDLAHLGARLLSEVILDWVEGKIKPVEQDHSQAAICKKITREDGKIDWSQPAQKIHNQIRALNPDPGTWTMWNGKVVNIKEAKILNDKYPNIKAGEIIQTENRVLVGTGSEPLILQKIQLEGTKEMSIDEFIRGRKDFINSKLG